MPTPIRGCYSGEVTDRKLQLETVELVQGRLLGQDIFFLVSQNGSRNPKKADPRIWVYCEGMSGGARFELWCPYQQIGQDTSERGLQCMDPGAPFCLAPGRDTSCKNPMGELYQMLWCWFHLLVKSCHRIHFLYSAYMVVIAA